MKKRFESIVPTADPGRSCLFARAATALVIVGAGLWVSACASTSSSSSTDSSSSAGSSGSGFPGASLFGMGERSEAKSSGGSDEGESPSIDGLKLSKVTLRGLQAAGVRDLAGLVAWFNAIPGDADPFFAPMAAEIDGASASAESIEALRLSGVTVEALAAQDITAPSGLAAFDRKALKDSRKSIDLCRNEIARVMQTNGWTVLRAEITNGPRASRLALNGEPIGPIAAGDQPIWRRFLVNAPGSSSDQIVFATLSVDIPDSRTGMPPVRWYGDVEIPRGGELRMSIDVAAAPLPSIGFAANTPLSPAAVYAGDTVTLTCEGGGDQTIWFTFGSSGRLSGENYRAVPSANSNATGLPAWFRLRSIVEQAANGRTSLLEEPRMEPVLLGVGRTLSWKPEFETPEARIAVLTRAANGFWGFAERSIAVADLRPPLWMMPDLPVDADSRGVAASAALGVSPSPDNIYRTYEILSEMTYVATVGSPFTVDLRMDEYRDASLPLATVELDFGDGTAAVSVPAAEAASVQVEHTYGKAGDYRVQLRSRDAMGFERSHATNVRVVTATPAEVAKLEPAPARPRIRRRIEVNLAESSFDLFRRAAEQFANQVANQTKSARDGRSVVISHIHDRKDQELLDLMDSSLVSALLDEGATVLEREPLYQHVIDARGFVDASQVVVPDQGVAGGIPAPNADVVLDYKLKRAEVKVSPAGLMMVRTARIFAWIRVHDRKSMQILFDGDVTVSIGGTIAAAESAAAGLPWDSYPDGFMIREVREDKAVESVEIVPVQPAAPAAAVPAAPALPTKEEGVGGMLKGLFGN